ncbi:MAG: hypothetical protein IJT01_13190, partial [Selenomonadaceae bacterium]|nr:hypothetical protein [Selenomonadaceae bacterium]
MGRAWRAPIAVHLRRLRMLREVERFCREQGVIRSGEGIVVACSGGADSMALVQWLMEHRQQWKLRLCVAHF